jgi:hypothetical protein
MAALWTATETVLMAALWTATETVLMAALWTAMETVLVATLRTTACLLMMVLGKEETQAMKVIVLAQKTVGL